MTSTVGSSSSSETAPGTQADIRTPVAGFSLSISRTDELDYWQFGSALGLARHHQAWDELGLGNRRDRPPGEGDPRDDLVDLAVVGLHGVAILRVWIVTIQPGVSRGVTDGMMTLVGKVISTLTVLALSLSFCT